jgi:hypothetical protein
MKQNSWLPLALILLLQFWILANLTLFLAPELSLYPYFVSRGLAPYSQIVDQHFPFIFFGPLHLGQFGLSSPPSLRLLLYALVGVVNLEFWWLAGSKLKNLNQRLWLQLGFVLGLSLLAANHLWLETFALFFVISGLLLERGRLEFSSWVTGLLWGASAITRPLLAPFLLLLWWRTGRKPEIAGGVIISLLIVTWWLVDQQLLNPFLELLAFNGTYYAPMAGRLPDMSEFKAIVWVLGWLALVLKPSRLVLLAAAAAMLPSYPRFGLFHNLLLLTLPLWTGVKIRQGALVKIWLVLGLVLILRTANRQENYNFFYPESQAREIAVINSFQPTEVYFFGGPDQLYYLTNTLPPGGYYLPSLPWYHANQAWVERQIANLEAHPQALVVVNTASRVDGQDLINYSRRISQFIRDHYQLVETVGSLEIYQRSSGLALQL